ncbi:MAG: MBL fold metallo-hydrolase [Microbacteriaceae bacterium]|nr:MBL fold metallo-hydrolase [Microbacteriaceae bacterium]
MTPILSGLGWTRIPLPYEPFHVNVYLLEEPDGWVVVDTGLDNAACRAAWISLLGGALSTKPILRIIVTHWHNDHLGLAGWLTERTGARILMSRQEFFLGALKSHKPVAIS